MTLQHKIIDQFDIPDKWEQFTHQMRQSVFAAYRNGERGIMRQIRRFHNGAYYYEYIDVNTVTWRDANGKSVNMNRYGVVK